MAVFCSVLYRQHRIIKSLRLYSSMTEKRGLVLGVYSQEGKSEINFTKFAAKYNESVDGKLLEQINIAGPIPAGQTRVFWSLGKYPAVAVAGLGDASKWDSLEEINGAKENVRISAAAGAKSLLGLKLTDIEVEDFGDAKSAAEGAILGTWKYQSLKNQEKQSKSANVTLAAGAAGNDDWKTGEILAKTQNWVRYLMDSPANYMTPTIFANKVSEKLSPLNVKVEPHDRAWAECKKMGSYLSVSRGSDEPPIFLEITYNGCGDNSEPICLIGKGITFDSGGISIKPSSKMDEMRGDMGGSANVVGTIAALAELKAKVNVKGLIPLAENMPSGKATKPGDVVTAMNGKTICVDNTDAEGRLVLADALCYSAEFNPRFVVDMATLTGAIRVALGDCLSGVFSNNAQLWDAIHKAGSETGDRVWRMPLFKHYTSQMCDHDGYDLNNLGKGKGGGSCTAAAFLREFAPKDKPWMHIDIASVMCDSSDQPYLGGKGMSGRPVRTIVEFILSQASK